MDVDVQNSRTAAKMASKKKQAPSPASKKLPSLSRTASPPAILQGANGGGKTRKINQKKDLIEAVRKIELTHLHNVREMQKGPISSRGSGELPEVNDTTNKDISSLEDGVNLNARKYNELKMMVDRKQQELDRLTDELKELVSENEVLEKIKNRQNSDADQITMLEAEISTTVDSTDEKLYYRKKLEHMLQRLERNQLAFETHINGMEEALGDSKREYDEVKMLMRQLEAGKTEAMQHLQHVQQELQRERRQRDREMNERAAEANNAKRMEQWRLKREQERLDMAAQLRGDLDKEGERRLLAELKAREEQSEALKLATQEKTEKAAALESAFLQIRQATGISSLDEMVTKFMSQGANRDALEQEKAEAEARLAKVKATKEALMQQFAELKASGTGATEVNREVYESLEQEIFQLKANLKVHKAACERLENVLVAVRQGALGLAQKLAAIDVGGDLFDEQVVKDGSDVVASLRASEAKLVKMMEVVSQQPRRQTAFAGQETEEQGGGENEGDHNAKWNGQAEGEVVLNRNNIRVQPPKSSKPGEGEEAVATARLGDYGSDDDNDADNTDDLVPTRQFLKLSSNRQYADIIRKKENADRRQKALEKMAEEGDGKGMTAMIRKKQQEDYMAKLAVAPQPVGMPEGVTLRSDPMEKSQAFLTHVPDLT